MILIKVKLKMGLSPFFITPSKMRRKSAKLLKPGKTYTFQIWSDVYTGVFMTYSYRGRNQYDEHVEFKPHRLYSNYEY